MLFSKHLNKITIFVIILIALIIIKNEHFNPLTVDQGHNNVKIFNNNYNKPWFKNPTAYNSTKINEFPLDSKFVNDFPTTFFPYIGTELFDLLILKFNNLYTKKFDKGYNILVIRHFNVNPKKYNINTWINKYNWDPDSEMFVEYTESDIFEVNYFNKFFIKNLNEIYKNEIANNDLFKKMKEFDFYSYFIYRYTIDKYLFNTDEKVFEITLQLLSKYSLLSPQLYCIVKFNKNSMYINSVEIIGYSNTSDILIRNNKKEKYFNTINSFDNQGFPRNIRKLLKDRRKNIKKDKIENQYACFNTNSEIWNGKGLNNLFIRSNNKLDCENPINWYGEEHPNGIWDRKCNNDSECSYYKSNKNYDNKFGKCLKNGYCEFPKNTLNLGYHFKVDNNKYKEKCYNCDTDKWQPITKLGECCDEQRDKTKTKYSFLKGPDYAFNNDLNERVNAKLNNKNIGYFKNFYIKYPYFK